MLAQTCLQLALVSELNFPGNSSPKWRHPFLLFFFFFFFIIPPWQTCINLLFSNSLRCVYSHVSIIITAHFPLVNIHGLAICLQHFSALVSCWHSKWTVVLTWRHHCMHIFMIVLLLLLLRAVITHVLHRCGPTPRSTLQSDLVLFSVCDFFDVLSHLNRFWCLA